MTTTKKSQRKSRGRKRHEPLTHHLPHTHHHSLSCFYGPNWRETTRGGWSKSPRACRPPRTCLPNEICDRRWSNQCIFQTRSTNNVAPLLCQRPRTCELNPMLMGRRGKRKRERRAKKGKEGALEYARRQVPTPVRRTRQCFHHVVSFVAGTEPQKSIHGLCRSGFQFHQFLFNFF